MHKQKTRQKPKKVNLVQSLSDLRSFRLSTNDFNRSVEEFLSSLDCSLALKASMLYKYGEHDQLSALEINPLDYNSPSDFFKAFQAMSFLRKASFLRTSFDRKDVALASFKDAELRCSQTNRRFCNLGSDPLFTGPNVWLLNSLVRKIHDCLGAFDFDELLDVSGWGPGVTLNIKGSNTSQGRKFASETGISSPLYQLLADHWNRIYPLWDIKDFKIQEFAKVATVPKNAKTDRTIAIEPGLNSWFQKGIGNMIRKRLRRSGYDLNSDKRNQNFARIGSKFGNIATVDFSAASDTIAKDLVREILPGDWHHICNITRSSGYTLEGRSSFYEKFSSMGNGFTFELESLIFVFAAESCCEYLGLGLDFVSVFGDDITIDSRALNLYRDFCDFLGFQVNSQKTHHNSPFRESCGAYFFSGRCVKPLFQKEIPTNAKSVYRMANSIRELAHRRNFGYGCDRSFLGTWKSLVRRLPPTLRLGVSRQLGDFGIHQNFDEALPTKNRHQIEGFSVRCLISIPVQQERDDIGTLLRHLYRLNRATTVSELPSGNFDIHRSKVRHRFARISVGQWYDFGPWV